MTHLRLALSAVLCTALFAGDRTEAQGIGNDAALLDAVINQEIDSREGSIREWKGKLAKMDMSIDVELRVQTFMQFLTQEIAYLRELKANGIARIKKAYCTMVIQQRIATMRHEVRFMVRFGNTAEALPKSYGERLSDEEVEAVRKRLEETVALEKKIASL